MRKFWPNFKVAYCEGVHVEGSSETTKESWSPNKDLNPGFIYAYSIFQKILIEAEIKENTNGSELIPDNIHDAVFDTLVYCK